MTARKIFAAFMIVFTVLLSSFVFYAYQVYNTPNILVDKEDAYFAIPSNSSFREVQELLYEGGYVQDAVSFGLLAKLKDYDKLVKPGLYLLQGDMSNNDAINLLRSGHQTPTTITFNGIRRLEELPEKITAGIEITPTQFEEVLFDKDQMISYGFDSLNYISMFLPNTYEVYWTTTASELLQRMNDEYKRFWNPTRLQKADSMGLSANEVANLASIVQSETAKLDEADIIAGVYLNRLKSGMPLQADPTLIFGLNDFTIRRVLNKDKKIESPYNTYINKGLPPGPIRIPDSRYIDAVLNYEDHNYLFFCAKEDFSGYHVYATNLRDHMVNARKFQRAMNQAKIYR